MFERNYLDNTSCSSHFPESTLSECLQTILKIGDLGVVIVETPCLQKIPNCGPGNY